MKAGLDELWVSIDGSTPEGFAGLRPGEPLGRIVESLRLLRALKRRAGLYTPHLGVVFVASRRNIGELPAVADLAIRLGAGRLLVTNVLPYAPEMKDDILYRRALWCWGSGRASPAVSLPRMDALEETVQALGRLQLRADRLDLEGPEGSEAADTCPFVERGSLAVRWDGQVSPCLPLLHTHSSYLGETRRVSRAHSVGSVLQRGLADIWQDADYLALRRRLQEFDFSPCTACNSCEMAEGNQEDCFGNRPPACGGCLWAQGFIRCP